MEYVKEHAMEKVARGIYITDDVWPDELFILQTKNPTVIFSGETALYLHGLIDREYTEVCITVPNGYNATRLKSANVRVKYVTKEIHGMGVCSVPSISGNTVRAYDQERCICELIKEFSDSSKRVYGREREKFIQIGGICRKTENQGRSNEICGGTGMIHTSKQLKDKVRNLSNLERLYKIYTSS